MALYDGFFDAILDDGTGEYDRAYASGDFTGYFGNLIGSGVCIHNNPDSLLVRLEDGKAVVSPGYLFIQGYWLKNDADYPVDLPGTGNYAIVAHLNLGKRLIEIEARSVSQAYPDSLVLAIVSPTSAEDTRHNTDLCGTIDAAGELSQKVEWAVNYIDNEIEDKLQAAEDTIKAQERRLDEKIAEVQAQVDRISPPPVGSIKFSASQDIDDEWLQCDGSFVNEADYPELVAALGKLTPSGDKFQLISSGEIGPQISNGVLYGGRMWVYSYSTKKLYGVDVEGASAVKEIALESNDEHFNDFIAPTNASPLCLSIVPHTSESGAKIFLSQIIKSTYANSYNDLVSSVLIYCADFSESGTQIQMNLAFTSATVSYAQIEPSFAVPTITSNTVSGVETYYCTIGYSSSASASGGPYYLSWANGENAEAKNFSGRHAYILDSQRAAFSRKSKNQIVHISSSENNGKWYYVFSAPFNVFGSSGKYTSVNSRTQPLPLNIVGQDKVLSAFDKNLFPWVSITQDESKTVAADLPLPSAARIFVDGGVYLWGKDIYMIFVGTGIIFSRTLEDGDFGYLDTTSVLGTITQFGYLDYSQDEGTLYLLGQDTTNTVKVAKIVLNTLYDYANDGAWLPMIAADGVPAYIKVKESGGGEVITDPVDMKITVTIDNQYGFAGNADIIFNGGVLIAGTYTRTVSASGTFTVGLRQKKTSSGVNDRRLYLNDTEVVSLSCYEPAGTEKTVTHNVADFISGGIALRGY